MVRTDNDGFKLKSLNCIGFILYNTKAIQELKLENDELEKKVDDLEMKLNIIYEKLNTN